MIGIDRDAKFDKLVDSFVGETINKPYQLWNKLITRAEGDGYFCSELVAQLYIRLGLLDPDIPAMKYWPGSWSQN